MIYLSKYINNTAINIKINLYICQSMLMMLTANDININLYICQKHVMIPIAIYIKIYTIYNPQTHKICVRV